MTTSIWDTFSSSGEYVTFTDVGDSVTGIITAIRTHTFDDSKTVPQLELDTADGPRTLTAGQIRLKIELVEKRPQVGEHLTVTLTGIQKRPGGKTLKEFQVTIGADTPLKVAPPMRLADQIKADRMNIASQKRAPIADEDAPF